MSFLLCYEYYSDKKVILNSKWVLENQEIIPGKTVYAYYSKNLKDKLDTNVKYRKYILNNDP
jgi:hypothetical protein